MTSSKGRGRGSTREAIAFSPDAHSQLVRRIGTTPMTPSASLIVNSLLLRYAAVVDEIQPRLRKKFKRREFEAMIEACSRIPDRRDALFRLDRGVHTRAFSDLMLEQLPGNSRMRLSPDEQNQLHQVLSRNTSAAELWGLLEYIDHALVHNEERAGA